MTRCLLAHPKETCGFSVFKTLITGIVGIVLNQDLSQFIAVREKRGAYLGPTAVTGAVEDSEETPAEAAAREVEEEAGVAVDPSVAVLVGTEWTSSYRHNTPETSWVFAWVVGPGKVRLQAQEDVVAGVEWLDVQTFLGLELKENLTAPFLHQRVVEAGRRALETRPQSTVESLISGAGKSVHFYPGV
jgi:8-oxo-dGTP pyrophosphatase MutT (NUDIX family)